MAVEFERLSRRLANKGFVEASSRTRSFARDLKREGLIPDTLAEKYTSFPDLSYMFELGDEGEIAKGHTASK